MGFLIDPFKFGGNPYIIATGGTESTATISGTDYKFHTFLTSGTLAITKTGIAEAIIVAGGGGDTSLSTGGGGGGVVHLTTIDFTSTGNYTVTVGAGGNSQNAVNAPPPYSGGYIGLIGNDSSLDYSGSTATAYGGKPSYGWLSNQTLPSNSGSGTLGATAVGTVYGGLSAGATGSDHQCQGGGGGAGTVGLPTSGVTSGNGGNGKVITGFEATDYYYGGGGGGGSIGTAYYGHYSANGGLGGGGGGGGGHYANGSSGNGTGGGSARNTGGNGSGGAAGNGGANTGGGAGGGWYGNVNTSYGKGGSGIVVVRYEV